MSNPILEGVFAIHKPTAISSAQVLRDLQNHLNPSKAFAPWMDAERARREAEIRDNGGKRSRKNRHPVQVKMGHGGTLDPMATGVLIVGVGNGTKSLQGFLDGTKTYETVMVFGAATDTYDSEGKIVKRAPYEHVTRIAVEEALAKFRGDIMQKPPIFSALRVQGKRLYEYAREGIEVPVEIQERPVTVSNLEITEWLEPGSHRYNFPNKEADQEEKEVADKLLHLEEPVKKEGADQDPKRKREEDGETAQSAEPSAAKRSKADGEEVSKSPKPLPEAISGNAPQEQSLEDRPAQDNKPCPAPAVRIRMTVSSGFYVRSLCHDLGAAVNSLGFMAELARTQASEFELGKNTLEYDDLERGEDVWGPKLKDLLDQWNEKHPNGLERQSQPAKRQHGSAQKPKPNHPHNGEKQQRQRNSSSPEA